MSRAVGHERGYRGMHRGERKRLAEHPDYAPRHALPSGAPRPDISEPIPEPPLTEPWPAITTGENE